MPSRDISQEPPQPVVSDAVAPRTPPKRKSILRHIAEAPLAVIVLFEAWGWEPLQRALGKLSRFGPIEGLEKRIAQLSPRFALAVYAVPWLGLIPVKIIGGLLLHAGFYFSGVGLIIAAKVFGTAVVARLFKLTQPALMQIPWFARAYNKIVPWKNNLVKRIHDTRIYKGLKAFASEVRETVAGWFSGLRRQ
jgi:hypothetical protein